jgi:hypothetical protein
MLYFFIIDLIINIIFRLTIDNKEKPQKIYEPNYKTNLNYIKPEKKIFDRSDWPIRKYKIYNEFTKTFDKTTNIEK